MSNSELKLEFNSIEDPQAAAGFLVKQAEERLVAQEEHFNQYNGEERRLPIPDMAKAFSAVVEDLVGGRVEPAYMAPDRYPLDLRNGEGEEAANHREEVAVRFGDRAEAFKAARLKLFGPA